MNRMIAITGTSGYSGRYMAQEAVRRGYRVLGLTNSPLRADDVAECHAPLCWDDEDALTESLRGCEALINTYWVRFDYGHLRSTAPNVMTDSPSRHAAEGRPKRTNRRFFSHEQAVEHTLKLFRAAERAGVSYIVHTSITKPDAASPLPYFRGKAQLEEALTATGIPHTVLRPAVLFGETPAESILINNMAWALRHLPLIGTPGKGEYRLAPIHVVDYAALALDALEAAEPARVMDAVGAETYSFRELWQLMGQAIGCPRPVLPMPPLVVRAAAAVLGCWQGDVMLTSDEIRGLMQDRLAVDGAPGHGRRLSEWLRAHAQELGRSYASELARRR